MGVCFLPCYQCVGAGPDTTPETSISCRRHPGCALSSRALALYLTTSLSSLPFLASVQARRLGALTVPLGRNCHRMQQLAQVPLRVQRVPVAGSELLRLRLGRELCARCRPAIPGIQLKSERIRNDLECQKNQLHADGEVFASSRQRCILRVPRVIPHHRRITPQERVRVSDRQPEGVVINQLPRLCPRPRHVSEHRAMRGPWGETSNRYSTKVGAYLWSSRRRLALS